MSDSERSATTPPARLGAGEGPPLVPTPPPLEPSALLDALAGSSRPPSMDVSSLPPLETVYLEPVKRAMMKLTPLTSPLAAAEKISTSEKPQTGSSEVPAPEVAPARIGVLLVNLGTPEAPTAPAVRRYLREFLSDPRV